MTTAMKKGDEFDNNNNGKDGGGDKKGRIPYEKGNYQPPCSK